MLDGIIRQIVCHRQIQIVLLKSKRHVKYFQRTQMDMNNQRLGFGYSLTVLNNGLILKQKRQANNKTHQGWL